MRRLHGRYVQALSSMHTRESLSDDLLSLGITPGDAVSVHASVRAVGEIAGGPDEIHLALKDAVGAEGSIMMYAGCPRYYDEIGRGKLTAEQEAEVLEKLPAFDAHTARSDRDNGALVELLRTYPGSRVNDHVTRFVVWGRQAEYLISTQPWDYAYGRESAFDRLVELGGKILLLGSDHDNVTFLHYVEHIADIPDRRVLRFKVPVIVNGERTWRTMEEFDTSLAAHDNWPDHFFAMIVDGYLNASGNRGGRVGGAMSYLLDAPAPTQYALPIMEAVAADSRAADTLVKSHHDE